MGGTREIHGLAMLIGCIIERCDAATPDNTKGYIAATIPHTNVLETERGELSTEDILPDLLNLLSIASYRFARWTTPFLHTFNQRLEITDTHFI